MDAKGKEITNLDHVLSQFAYKGDHINEEVLKKSETVSKRNGKRRIADMQAPKVSPYFQKSSEKQDMPSDECNQQHNLLSQAVYKGRSDEKLLKKGKNVSKQNGKKRRADVHVQKVSPYFQSSREKQDMIRENRKLKPKVLKRSPYFQNNNETADGIKKPKKTAGDKPFLSAFKKRDEAYERKTPNNTWIPPRSKAPLLQEDHAHDPWRVLVICMLLNKTSGKQTRKVLSDLFTLCPDAKTATEVTTGEIEKVIETLGLQRKRAEMIKRMSEEYLWKEWTHVTELHGVGNCNQRWQFDGLGD
ncbi:hypothetical protein DITRI_Ditri20bG0131900 [Diplodiscus trichospermus]